MVVASVAVRQETGCKHDDGIHTVAIVTLIIKKKTEREKKGNFISHSPGYYGNSLHCVAHLFPCFFLFASQALFLSLSLLPFLLDTLRKSVISFCSRANSSPHSVSLNQSFLWKLQSSTVPLRGSGFSLQPRSLVGLRHPARHCLASDWRRRMIGYA